MDCNYRTPRFEEATSIFDLHTKRIQANKPFIITTHDSLKIKKTTYHTHTPNEFHLWKPTYTKWRRFSPIPSTTTKNRETFRWNINGRSGQVIFHVRAHYVSRVTGMIVPRVTRQMPRDSRVIQELLSLIYGTLFKNGFRFLIWLDLCILFTFVFGMYRTY